VPLLQRWSLVADGLLRRRRMTEPLLRNGVTIDDGFAEAFPMKPR